MSWIGAIGSAIASGGLGIISDLSGGWAGNSSKESLNKNITKTNLKYQKEYDLWTQEQDKKYNKWWQNYLYELQNNEYYELSKKYAMNTAKWAVDGLKAAGLNPILAAQNPNMSSNLGNASPSTTAVSSGKNSGVRGAAVSSGSGGASRNFAAISQIMNSSKQIEMQENLQKAQIDNINADTVQKRMGDTSWGNNLLAVGNVLDSVGLKEPLKKMAVKAADWMTSQLGIGGDGNSAHSDALKRRADEVYNPLTDASRRGIIDDDSLDKINAAGHSRDAEMSPRERERERRLRNGRRIMRQRQYNGGRPNDF